MKILKAGHGFRWCFFGSEWNPAQVMHQLIQCGARERKCPVSEPDSLNGGCRGLQRINDLHKLGMKASEALTHQGEQYFILIGKVLVDKGWTVLNRSGNRANSYSVPSLVRRDHFCGVDYLLANRSAFPLAALLNSHHSPR